MIVVGGTYRESCTFPDWNEIYGSGGRAFAAIRSVLPQVEFITCATEAAAFVLEARSGLAPRTISIESLGFFGYWTPLNRPHIVRPSPSKIDMPSVQGDVVLRFGMLEADPVVSARRAVYDPQNESSAAMFQANGSVAEHYVVVANEREIRAMGRSDDSASAAAALIAEGADAVFIKRGPRGVRVYDGCEFKDVPAYRTKRAFTIGSGDVFSAAIAYHWGNRELHPFDAAELASRATAEYVETRQFQLDEHCLLRHSRPAVQYSPGSVYLAGPFFDLGQRRMIEDSREHLLSVGLEVLSPIHLVGRGAPKVVATKDLDLLSKSSVVFAHLDGMDAGTIFEVGYARAIEKRVVAYTQRTRDEDLTMLIGTNCEVYDDYVAAIFACATET